MIFANMLITFLHSPSSLSSFSFSFFSLSLSTLCADSLRALELASAFPYSSSRKRAASPLLKSSDMLRAAKRENEEEEKGVEIKISSKWGTLKR